MSIYTGGDFLFLYEYVLSFGMKTLGLVIK